MVGRSEQRNVRSGVTNGRELPVEHRLDLAAGRVNDAVVDAKVAVDERADVVGRRESEGEPLDELLNVRVGGGNGLGGPVLGGPNLCLRRRRGNSCEKKQEQNVKTSE